MKLVVETLVKSEETVDVEFPIYFDSSDSTDSGGWSTFQRVDADGSLWVITKRYGWSADDPVEYEFEAKRVDLRRYLGDMLKSPYTGRSTAEEFNSLLAEARGKLAEFPSTPAPEKDPF